MFELGMDISAVLGLIGELSSTMENVEELADHLATQRASTPWSGADASEALERVDAFVALLHAAAVEAEDISDHIRVVLRSYQRVDEDLAST